MARVTDRPPFTCASCEAPIVGPPVIHVGVAFCCAGCVAGGPCLCSYDEETRSDDQLDRAARQGDPIQPARVARHPVAPLQPVVADDQRGLVPARR
ncbi:MAG TPA: hypothetical protein VFS32_12695 [Candidatus Limnocylindrales bacterium]|nr:hypothetical protein [Candidatus Limnocylindrales bacterium]